MPRRARRGSRPDGCRRRIFRSFRSRPGRSRIRCAAGRGSCICARRAACCRAPTDREAVSAGERRASARSTCWGWFCALPPNPAADDASCWRARADWRQGSSSRHSLDTSPNRGPTSLGDAKVYPGEARRCEPALTGGRLSAGTGPPPLRPTPCLCAAGLADPSLGAARRRPGSRHRDHPAVGGRVPCRSRCASP